MKNTRKRKGIWHADFSLDGRRYRQSLETTDWREAARKAANLIALAKEGRLTPESHDFSRLPFPQAVERWLEEKKPRVAPKTIITECERSDAPKKFFGPVRLSQLTAESILAYIRSRTEHGIANATVNRELDIIRGVLKRARLWYRVAEDVKPLPVRHNIGRAMPHEEKVRLLKTAASRPEWQTARLAMILALNTTMRGCELKGLHWRDMDFIERTLTIRRSTTKTDAGERVIPLNAEAWAAMLELRDRVKLLLGQVPEPDWYVFPHAEGLTMPDPTRPMSGWRTAWRSLTRAIRCPCCGELQRAGLTCRNQQCKADIRGVRSSTAGLRFHDLRHHAITELAESQIGDQVIMDIAGHVSRDMLRHYSHIRLEAKRRALDVLSSSVSQNALSREFSEGSVTNSVTNERKNKRSPLQLAEKAGGRQGIRTPGLLVANEALSQLS